MPFGQAVNSTFSAVPSSSYLSLIRIWVLARGGIVDEDALYRALEERHIAGAALDCFENEPVTQPHRFRSLPNVLLAPHSIAWTHDLFRDIGRAACQGMVDLANGKRPRGCVNPEVFDRPGFHEKWSRLQREV